MEYITAGQLESFESILEDINREHEEFSKLNEQVKKVEDKITGLNIALFQNELSKQICYTTVKIFNTAFEIYYLYKEDFLLNDMVGLTKHNNCKYYLLEIYMSKSLIEKMMESWQLHINIFNQRFSVNKVMKLVNKNPIKTVIPVDETVIDCELVVNLFSSIDGNWAVIRLFHLNIDVSFHFETLKDEKDRTESLLDKCLNVSKLYNDKSDCDLDSLHKPMFFEYRLNCKLLKEQFTEIMLHHSVHKLDIELFSELTNEMEKPVNVSFCIRNGNKCIASYDKKTGNVKLKCTADDLHLLKKYILKEYLKLGCKNDQEWLSTWKKLSARHLEGTENFEELKSFLEENRKLVHQLPV